MASTDSLASRVGGVDGSEYESIESLNRSFDTSSAVFAVPVFLYLGATDIDVFKKSFLSLYHF